MAAVTGYVHLNLSNIVEELDSLERDLLVSGDQHPLQRIKEIVRTKPYYMAEETERILAGQHGIDDALVVGTAHDDCYVLERHTDGCDEALEFSRRKIRAWLSDTPIVSERRWEPLGESLGDHALAHLRGQKDYRPVFSANSLEKARIKEWLSKFPYRGSYTKTLPARWSAASNYRALTVETGFYEDHINAYDFEHYVGVLYPPDIRERSGFKGVVGEIESVEEAFEVAERIRQSLEVGGVWCEPVVHIAGYTDSRLGGNVSSGALGAGLAEGEAGRVERLLEAARRLRATGSEVEAMKAKLDDPYIQGKRRRWIERQHEEWKQMLAAARRDFLMLCPDEACEALLTLEAEQTETKDKAMILQSAFGLQAPEEFERWSKAVGWEDISKEARDARS